MITVPAGSLRGTRGRNKVHHKVRPRLEALEDRLAPAALPTDFFEAAVATGLSNATAMEFAPDGRLWALEQAGKVKVFNPASTTGWTALQIPPSGISSTGERGLLGIAFDPDYDINDAAPDYVYLYYTATSPNIHNRVSRFTVDNSDPDQPSLGSESVILDLDALGATNHNGGAIHFGPDGKLFIAVGDNANGNNAQSVNTRLGKILRINADGSIPSDNPTSFDGISAPAPTGANRAIWAVGLRNPYTFTFQPGTGRMFINDVGEGSWEEINQGAAGANYGWPTTEGTFNQSLFPGFTQPFYAYSHGSGAFQGFAITGGAFYNPAAPTNNAFPSSFTGDYFFADFVNDWIHVGDFASGNVAQFAVNANGPVDLRVADDGSLYYLSRGDGSVFRVVHGEPGQPMAQSPSGTITTDLPTFTWTAVANATHYDVWVDDATTGESQVLRNKNVSGTTWTPDPADVLTPGHTYTWWAGAVGVTGHIVWSGAQTFTIQALAAPTAVSPAGTIGTLTPTFTWTAASGVTRYDIWVDDTTTGQSQVLRNRNASGTSWTASTSLTANHTYVWWAGSVSASGAIFWSQPKSFTIAVAAVSPAGTITTTLPTFTWTAVAGADHYDVWVDDRTTGQQQVLRNQNAFGTSWTASTALAAHSYMWWVGAVSASGAIGWSAPQTFTIAPIPQSPAGSITTDQPTFTWTAITGISTYDVWVDDTTTGQSQVLRNTSATGTSWAIGAAQALSPGHTYRWWVGTVTAGGTIWAGSLTFSIAALATPVAQSPSGTANESDDTPTFMWTAVTNATRYDIWVDDRTTGQQQVLRNLNATGTSWTPPSPLTSGHSYRWWVRAISANGTMSLWSDFKDFFLT